MVITKVFGGGLTPASRSLASVAIVIVCQPADAGALIWASNVSGGTTRPLSEFRASAGGTIRWYMRIGTWRARELTPTVSALTGIAVGTDLGLQLFTTGKLAAVGSLPGGRDPEEVGIEPVVEPPTDIVAGEPPRPNGIVRSLEPPWLELPQATAAKRIATNKAPVRPG